jgi:hypothetical protein
MRAFFSQAMASAHPGRAVWLPGLPHAAVALASYPVFGAAACATGLLMAALVAFVLWLPLTALALNRGAPLATDGEAPPLTPNAKRILLILWTATAWAVAAMVG